MKRGLLIAGGAIGGLGAVMSITPPQFSSTNSLSIVDMAADNVSAPAASATPSISATKAPSSKPVVTKSATGKPVTKKTAAAATTKNNSNNTSNNGANAGANATNPTPAAVATTAAPAATGVSGTFTGPSVFVQYGNVQVQITVANGRITDAKAVVAPSGKNDRYTNMAVPILKQQTLAAQSANIQGATGASYTSYGWFKSLQGALAQAGL